MAHILIVDDSPTEIKVIKDILTKQGHNTSEAFNGEEGVQKAKELLPDLIIMDVVMPRLNGYQATRQITTSTETKAIPVVLVSAKNMGSDKIWGLKMGAKDYVVKPFKADDLLKVITRQLG
jgi:twitching motility two-component system response regulator PilH